MKKRKQRITNETLFIIIALALIFIGIYAFSQSTTGQAMRMNYKNSKAQLIAQEPLPYHALGPIYSIGFTTLDGKKQIGKIRGNINELPSGTVAVNDKQTGERYYTYLVLYNYDLYTGYKFDFPITKEAVDPTTKQVLATTTISGPSLERFPDKNGITELVIGEDNQPKKINRYSSTGTLLASLELFTVTGLSEQTGDTVYTSGVSPINTMPYLDNK